MSQQSVRQAARRSALDAQAVLRKERSDRERRLEALAVAVLIALGESCRPGHWLWAHQILEAFHRIMIIRAHRCGGGRDDSLRLSKRRRAHQL
jgi:hypothetical protein